MRTIKLLGVQLKKFQIGAAALHLLFVVLMFWGIMTSEDGSAAMGWLLFAGIDFPVSLGWIAFAKLEYSTDFIRLSAQARNYYVPPIYFGIVGTIWWYFVPIFVYKLAKFLRKLLEGVRNWAKHT